MPPSEISSDPEPEAAPEQRSQTPASDDQEEPGVNEDNHGLQTPSAESIAAPVNTPVPPADEEGLLMDNVQWFEDLNECFHLEQDHAWRLEVNISDQDINRWRSEDQPCEMAFLMSAAKKQRSEVKMPRLTEQERKMFQSAKMKEIESWLATETVAKILRHQIPEENIMRCRWILTLKPVDQPSPDGAKHVPKARLVVLGYEDPLAHDIPRDSPTMSKLSRMLILQWAAMGSLNGIGYRIV